ncbi:NAD(P)-binding protein [Stemphylium lycopersici]|uniref:NAD(P)-binding protein n=1 Tax=Stemphylium lycopersici TaxID=183478 RepID=A0A364MWD2_STELY|nr:NAD(P)-binding protein [Stemphylium lycopersici]
MFKVPFYALLVAFLGPLVAVAQVVPAGASEGIASIVPTVYSSAATLVSAQPTSTGAANAHDVQYAAMLGVGGAALQALL